MGRDDEHGLIAEVMPDIGHMPMLEVPEQTAELVKKFISSTGRNMSNTGTDRVKTTSR